VGCSQEVAPYILHQQVVDSKPCGYHNEKEASKEAANDSLRNHVTALLEEDSLYSHEEEKLV
jgi:hypothetical protein